MRDLDEAEELALEQLVKARKERQQRIGPLAQALQLEIKIAEKKLKNLQEKCAAASHRPGAGSHIDVHIWVCSICGANCKP